MDWILEHLRFIIFIGIAIAAWIKKRGDARREEAETRRAVEQMANEIQPMTPQQPKWQRPERVTPTPLSQVLDPTPRARASTGPPPMMTRPISVPPPLAKPVDDQDELLQRQRDMQDRMLDVKKAKALAKAEPSGGARLTQQQTRGSEAAKTTTALPSLRESLSNPQHTRRAFILSEILGPPLSLK